MAPIHKECEYLVIGGGSGGIASARRAAGVYGVKTMVVESNRLGGTCVNVGCVPKKVTWNAAAVAETLKEAGAYGFAVEGHVPFDWPLFKGKRDVYVARLNAIYARNLAADKIEYVHGRAHLLSPTEVEVEVAGDGSGATSAVRIRARRILIATGGHPIIPTNIPGAAEHGITSDGFFALEQQPQRMAVIGAGYIGVEMAGMMAALGTETHLFIRHDRVLRAFDPLVQDTVTAAYERPEAHGGAGIQLYHHSTITRLTAHPTRPGWRQLHYTSSNHGATGVLDVDCVLWAIGRTPEIEDLGLDQAGVARRPPPDKGFIVVDDFQNTNVPNIHALGDVCGRLELTPVAIAAGRRLSDRLFGPAARFAAARLDYANVPSVVFAHPEVGAVGLTEPEARKAYPGPGEITVYQTAFTAMYYAMLPGDSAQKPPSAYKLICAGPDQRVVGLHLVGRASSEILQGFAVAMKMGATKADFDACVAIHPTSAEELVTMK
ncbi:MAG: Glutathione reductase [Phylliscum demangeonii]|nr:MAG: Glutathione reductase [Phylliscum demangeonii]